MFNRKGPKEPDPSTSTVSFQSPQSAGAPDPEEQFDKTADFNPNAESDPLATNLLSYNRRAAYPDLPDDFASEDDFAATEEIEKDETTEFIQVQPSEEKEARTVLLSDIPAGFVAQKDPNRVGHQTELQQANQTRLTSLPATQTEPVRANTGSTETTSTRPIRAAQREARAATSVSPVNSTTPVAPTTPRRRMRMLAVVAMIMVLFTVTGGGAVSLV